MFHLYFNASTRIFFIQLSLPMRHLVSHEKNLVALAAGKPFTEISAFFRKLFRLDRGAGVQYFTAMDHADRSTKPDRPVKSDIGDCISIDTASQRTGQAAG